MRNGTRSFFFRDFDKCFTLRAECKNVWRCCDAVTSTKLDATDGHSMQRTERDSADWELHWPWQTRRWVKEKRSLKKFSHELVLCFFRLNPNTARVFRIALSSINFSRRSHCFNLAFVSIYCRTALLIHTLNWSTGRLIYKAALCLVLKTLADRTLPQITVWTAIQNTLVSYFSVYAFGAGIKSDLDLPNARL